MCGIAGFYGFRNDKLIKKFSQELEHRGPDGEGFYIDKNVTLLNRRLAIIDVKTGQQPIYNEDKSIVVVFNGEIYNYLELRKELEKFKHKFTTKSDTEVIVHGYEQWGEKCFDRLNGMFAIALYDIKKKKLLLVRDHFGIKPLYYASTTSLVVHGLIFSSELKPLIYSGLINKRPNDKIIYRYLHDRVHDDTKETFFEGVYRVMPGQILIIQNYEFRIQNYSNLEKDLLKVKESKKLGNFETEKFKEELYKAIKYRLISEVPVGTCLSGGLDSSTVVAVVNDLLKKHVKESKSVGKIQNTFSAVFPGSSNDEEKYIDKLKVQMSNFKSYKIYPKPEEFFKDLQDFVRTQEEPTISTGPYAQYKVMQEAHKYVTVLLDGQGSDEMMAGYIPYYFVYFRQLLKEKKYIILIKEIMSSLDLIIKFSVIRINEKIHQKRIDLNKLLNPNFIKNNVKENFNNCNNNLKKRLVEDIFHNSLQSLLRYEDKNSMRFSIEGRVPFLDINLLRYIFSLPDEVIINKGWNKYVLRKATEDLLPELINKRRNKIGFTTPEYEWFMRMKNKIYSIFMSETFIKRKYFNQPEVIKAFQAFIEGKFDDTMVFWRMMNVEMWMREFIDPKVLLPRSGGLQPRNPEERDFRASPKGILTRSGNLQLSTPEERDFRASPNEGKKLEIEVNGKKYLRYPIKTELFEKGDEYEEKISKEIVKWFTYFKKDSSKQFLSHESLPAKTRALESEKITSDSSFIEKKWFVVISEKIVAISQGRSYFIWDIKPSIFAKVLSKYVTKTPYGIGLGSPWTMQIAIQEVGLPRICLATIVSGLGKIIGVKGLFYKVAGETVRSIDGPTEYSLYPSNVSAKLGPKDPQEAAEKITDRLNRFKIYDLRFKNFIGTVIIDANDIGRNVLGNTTGIPDKTIEEIMRDNPMGQADEQTPIIFVSNN